MSTNQKSYTGHPFDELRIKTQDKKSKSKKLGFTLVELLVSIAIVITSATVVVAIISATFRGSSKTSNNEQVRAAGNSAVNQLSSMIQYADSFGGAIKDSNILLVCSTSGTDTSVDSVKISTNGQEKVIACAGDDHLTLDGNSMFNRGKYFMSGCNLTCAQVSGSETPVIGIEFRLGLIGAGGSGFSESSSSLDFSKTVKMVNLNQ